MEIKCPNCMGALVFDADSGQMECKHCKSFFKVDDIETPQSDVLQCNVYACTSCGAELAVNDTEVSTFCAYCGQPTIVFDRVSDTQMPDFIVPFRISKENAMDRIRNRFSQGAFIPKEVKELELDKIHGIYIPYWLYGASYYDRQCIQGTVGKGDFESTRYFIREAKCKFTRVPMEASSTLDNDFSKRLEPYDMNDIKRFRVGYMAGFYADGYDEDRTELQEQAERKMKSLFDEQMLKSCEARNKSIISAYPQIEDRIERYALLPAWFMTFRYKDKPYTMLVNGQSGKVIGAAPLDRQKVAKTAILLFLLSLLISVPLGMIFSTMAYGDETVLFKVVLGILGVVSLMVGVGTRNRKWLERSITLTTSKKMDKFAHNRQKGGKEFE